MPLTPRMLLLGVTALTPSFAWAQALPTGGAYVAGSGSINTAGATTTIDQSSARGVINWQGFSIGAGGAVQFNNGSGATLNRVTGDQLSSLQGHLGATGTVFLINPNGVVVGPGGTVVTGGSFVASTRDTPNSAFMKGGNVTLSGTSAGTVTNAGKITSTNGNVVLVGAAVSNSGTISAAGGTAALVAGNQVVLSEADGPAGIYVVADSKAKGNATNTGQIKAAAATLASAGGNVYALAGNREGLVQATGTTTVNGQVWLSAPHGTVTVESTTLSATNADGSGGVIRANGEAVSLGGKAVLTASASKNGRKGGQILIGTDSVGGTNLARHTTVASGATLKATGKGTGAGGTIETSAHTLAIGAATVRAGLGGSWLLDPDNLTIDSAAASTINAALNSGVNVTEQTSATTASNINGAGTSSSGIGDIVLNTALNWNSTASLILSAYHSITLNADITVNGAGTLTLTTNNGIGGSSTGDGAVNFGGSTIQFTSSALTAANTASSSPLTIDGHGYTLITTANELQNAVGTSGYYALAKPLDMSSISNFTPLAQDGFSGTFNGLGNTISNLTINDSTDLRVGLFSYIVTSGVISHVGLIGGTVTDNFSNPYGSVGELVGFNANGTITDAYATGNVIGTNPAAYIGGLVGLNYSTITDSYATGNVTSTKTYNYTINYYSYLGGLVGYNGYGGIITNAYATGNVANTNSNNPYIVGGLAGNNSGTISNTYSSGYVSSTNYAYRGTGGLVGTNSSHISNSYWDTTTSGQSNGGSDYPTGLTTAQLAAALPTGFDTTIWGNLNNQTTPYLLGVPANQQVLSGSNTTFGTNAGTPVTIILNAAGLSAINSNLAGNYGLAADIDASSLGNTSPIGENTPFTGIFYGAGHTIANLTIADATDQYVGLFGQLGAGAKIEDIGLTQEAISSTYANGTSVGGLVGYNNGGTLSAVYTTGTVSGPQSAASTTSVGGLVGQNGNVGASGNTITSSYSTTAVSGGDTTYMGGLVGWNSGTITSSFASGAVSSSNIGNTYNFIGGLVGWNASGTIKTSYATGNVSGGNLAGGLVGQNHYGHIEETYAAGNVTGNNTTTNSGGLVGHDDVNDPSQLILDSYSTGSVNSLTGQVGGLIGGLNNEASSTYADSQYFSHDYFDVTTTGQNGNANLNLGNGVTGLTTTQWSQGSTSRFSNSADWVAGSPYPLLAALPYVVITASGTQIYGQSTPSVIITSILDQSGNNAASLTDTRSLTWTAPGVNSTSNVHSSSDLIGRGATATGYQVTYAGTDTITPAALTITANSQTGTYGQATTLNNSAYTANGLVNGDKVSSATLATNATRQSSVGTYAITASDAHGTGLENYTITYTTGTYTITPAALSITALDQTGTYGQNPTFNNTAFKTNGLVNGDAVSSISLATTADRQSSVGAYAMTASDARGTGLGNYAITYTTGSYYTITPAALTITALDQTGTYGQNPTLNNTAFKTNGLVNGNSVSSVSLATIADRQSNVGAYAITASDAHGTGLGNYAITYTTGAYTITPAALSITALDQTGIYGQTPTLNNAAFKTNGLVNGNSVSNVRLATSATSQSNVGAYAITASDAHGTGLGNYTITYTTGAYTITPAALSITALDQTGIYGQNPTFNNTAFKTNGLVNGDAVSSISLATTADRQSSVGAYAMTASDARGTGLGNYAITYTTGSYYTITPAALTITALDQTGTYGQTPTLNNTAFKTNGLVNGNSVSSVSLATTADRQSNVGAYAITASDAHGTGLGNYAITYTTGAYTITPAALSITALDQTGIYGQTPTLNNAAFKTNGLVNGDSVSSISLATIADRQSNVGAYAITASDAHGTGLGNYAITYTTGAYTITPAALSITALDQTGIYGQNPTFNNTAFKTNGLVNGDAVSSISLATTADRQSSVGAYAMTASDARGTGLGNYAITYTTGSYYTITPAALSITALDQTGTYGQNPTLNNTAFKTNGLINGDAVSSVSLATTADRQSSVGAYAITASNAKGTGLNNYAITYQNGLYNITRIKTIPIFWPMASLNGNGPAPSGVTSPTTAEAGDTPDLTLTNAYKPLTLPDGTAAATTNTYKIVLPATSYTNRLKDTF